MIDIESWKCSGKISFIADLARDCKIVGEKIVIVSHSLACLGKNFMIALLVDSDTHFSLT